MSSELHIEIRPENRDDYQPITRLNEVAFGRPVEALMIARLRHNPDYIPELSLVALKDDTVVGHILFFPIVIETSASPETSLALATMTVHPDVQGNGIGGMLIRRGMEIARDMGFGSIIVIGHPGYYPRFGFQPASKWGIVCPYQAPDEAFMALELSENALSGKGGSLKYPPEIDEAV